MKEITLKEIEQLNTGSYEIIDIRDEAARDYGMIPGAIAISFDEEGQDPEEKINEIPGDKKLIFYCDFGRKTRDLPYDWDFLAKRD